MIKLIDRDQHRVLVTKLINDQVKVIDLSTNRVFQYGNNIADLGDLLPLYIYSDKIEEIKDYLSKCINENIAFDDGIYLKGIRLGHRAYEYSDYLFGVYLYFMNSVNSDKEIILRLLSRCEYVLTNKDHSIKSIIVDTRLGHILNPVFDKLVLYEDIGMFLELHNIFKQCNLAFMDNANLTNSLCLSHIKHGLLPVQSAPPVLLPLFNWLRPRAKNLFQLHKETTNILFGLLAEAKNQSSSTSVEIIQLFLVSYFRKCNKINMLYTEQRGNQYSLDLTIFHLLDFLIEFSRFTGEDKYLRLYIELSKNLFQSNFTKIGLLPFYFSDKPKYPRINLGMDDSWLDSSVDFCVSMYKAAAYMNDKHLGERAKDYRRSIFKYHVADNKFYSAVDVQTGCPTDHNIKTKTIALVYKLHIAHDTYANGSIFDDYANLLLSDR